MKSNYLVLSKQYDFNRVYQKGISIKNHYFVVIILKNDLQLTRVGFVASKKVGNSVKRNRARRLLKAAYYTLIESLKEGYDIVLVAKKPIIDEKSQNLVLELDKAFHKGKII